MLNETKESHQIAFLYRCSGSKAESLIVSIYLVFTFHFRREHVNRQISAFCADFVFEENQNVNNEKNLNWQKRSDFPPHGHRNDMGMEYLISERELWNLSVYLSVYQNIFVSEFACLSFLQIHHVKSNVCKIFHVIMSSYIMMHMSLSTFSPR